MENIDHNNDDDEGDFDKSNDDDDELLKSPPICEKGAPSTIMMTMKMNLTKVMMTNCRNLRPYVRKGPHLQ